MDKDLEDRETKINAERGTKLHLQLEMFEASVSMTISELLRDKNKSDEYKKAWRDGIDFSEKYRKERSEIIENIYDEYEKIIQKNYAESLERRTDPNYYQTRDGLRRQVVLTIRKGVQSLFR